MTAHEVIRRSRPDDLPGLSRLFREAFNSDRPESVWGWKYFGERPGLSYVCEVEGRLVAHSGGIPVRFRDGRETYDALQSVDFMSTPSYAGGIGGGGVFVRTVRRMFAESCGDGRVQLVYGFPGERHRLVGERVLEYRPLEPVTEMTLPGGGTGNPEPLSWSALSLFSRTDLGMGAVRDESYLRWRYLAHPLFSYSLLRVRAGWPVRREAVALLRDSAEEFLLMEWGGSLGKKTVGGLVEELRRLGKPVKGWFSPRHPLGLLLQNRGFTATPRDHWLEYRFFRHREPLFPGQFYYTLGDYDVH